MSPDEARDAATIADLIEACARVVAFTASLEESGFYDSAQTRYATLYQILVLGEAVKRLSTNFRDKYPTIPSRTSLECAIA